MHKSKYGDLDITINLSKPEKDPREIALLSQNQDKNIKYPKTMLKDINNEGYSGRIDFPGRQNHRTIEIKLDNENGIFNIRHIFIITNTV